MRVTSWKVDDGHDPRIVIDGPRVVRIGDALDAIPGLRGVLDRPLFEVLLALARRRAFGSGDGTTSAEALVLDVRHLSAAAIRHLLHEHIDESTEDIAADGTGPVVAFVAPRSSGRRGRPTGGASKGPYRFTLAPSAIDVPAAEAPIDAFTPASDRSLEASLETARRAVAGGDFSGARRHLVRACSTPARSKGPRERILLARAWNDLAYVEMELGLSRPSVAAAHRASLLVHDRARCDERVQAWLIQAHALGQLADREAAELHARRAMALAGLGRSPGHLHRIRDPKKIELVGVWGQYLSRAQRFDEAEPLLEAAHRAATEAGDRRWSQTWLGRLAEHELQRGRVAMAERWLDRATQEVTGLHVSTSAFLTRLCARFMVAAGRWEEAARWLRLAYAIGTERSMRHQLHLLEPLRAHPELATRLGDFALR